MLTDKQKKILQIFFDPKQAGSFSNPATMKKILQTRPRKHVKVPSLKQIKDFLASKRAYTVHRPARKNYPMKRVIVGGVGIQLQMDLIDMQQWARKNDHYKYILLAIDCFSRYAYARPLKSKHGNLVSEAIESILNEAEHHIDRQIEKIQTDEGLEFHNKSVKTMLAQRGIHLFSTKSPTKAQMAERLIRTLRSRQEKLNTHRGTTRWLESFFDFVKSYNKTHHSALPNNMSPKDVNLKNESQVWHHLYGKELLKTPLFLQRKLSAKNQTVAGLKVGDAVRLSKRKRTFEKAYYQNWTDEIFFVAHISKSTNPVTFRIKDADGEHLEGVFYRPELTPVKLDTQVYAIEKVLKQERRRDGKTYYQVKWRGYPDSHNSWIRADQFKPIDEAS